MFLNSLFAKAARCCFVLSIALGLAALHAAPAHAQSSVTNIATVTPPDGVVDPDPSNNSDDAVVTVTPAAAPYEFCPAGAKPIFSIVNGVHIWRYEPGAANDAIVPELSLPVDGNLNGLMVDPERNRLLFVSRPTDTTTTLWVYDAANGGWYEAVSDFTSPDFPRAGMTPDGVGYLIAGGSNTPQVWRVTPDGGFGYAVQNIGNLSYDINPTDPNSGDIAFDGNGVGWLAAGLDLYTVDMTTLQATRQTRPLLGGEPAGVNWAGNAFAEDGTLYVANNQGAGGSRYYAYDPATGNLTPGPATSASASRDLASCAFPLQAEPELSVVKTLAQVNAEPYTDGDPVLPGDTLSYLIEITNTGGAVATLYPGDVVETLPDNTTVVTSGNDFTCTGSDCPNTEAVNVPAGDSVGLNFVVQVDDPLPPGVESIANAVTVESVDCAEAGNDCEESTPVGPVVTVEKTSDVGDGTPVSVGDTITYALTVTVANAATTEAVTLTDTLSAGLSFGAVTDAGAFTCTGELECVLSAGTDPGTYTVTYTATVDDDATTSVSNSVVADGGTCGTCETTNPVATTITVVKSSDPADGSTVAPGQTIVYTVTVTVSNSNTTQDLTLADTLGAGLSFGEVTDAGDFVCSGALECVLEADTAPGTYAVTYTATVDADATGTVGNVVTASNPPGGDPDPVCTSCETEHEIEPTAITVAKSSNPASGETVLPGATIVYTLTVTVSNSNTTQDLTLSDTLGAGLSFGEVTDAGDFTCSGELECVLGAGAAPGTYAVTYTATVDADATGTVGNVVTASNPPGGDPDPVCTSCETEHEIEPTAITVVKSSNPASGGTVLPGQTIVYTLTVTVSNSNTTQDLTLSDTLGAGLSFGEVTDAGDFVCSGALECVLEADTAPGTYAVTYTATVDADATGTLGNVVTATNPPGGDPDPVCTTCETEHEVEPAGIVVNKSSNPATGSTVLPGATIVYTLTVTVSNSNTTQDLTLSDTLGAGLSFGEVTDAGDFTCSGELECVLGAGAAPGTYAVIYTATVDDDATGTVGNVVTASNPPGGDPDPVCGTCATEHEIEPTAITVVKGSNPASGGTVLPGQTIVYTLTVTVSNSNTTQDLTLSDTLGAGLSFGEVTDAGDFTCTGELECVLAADTAPGTYTVTYTATVDADATGTVGNNVTASNPPGGDPDPVCTSCATEHEIEPTAITVAKSSNPASGETVLPGATIVYTLTVTVSNSNTTQDLTLTDTLGAGLTFGAVTDAGAFICTGELECVLAAGTAPGTYAVTYTATVDADATGTVGNVVTASNPPGGDPDPVCTTCATEHEIEPTAITVVKSSDPADGSTVAPGQTIVYTLTVTVSNSNTTQDLTLADTLGAGLTFGAVTDAGAFACTGALECVLAAGTAPGTYAVTYTATVDADATGTLGNVVTATNPPGGDPDPVCTSCETEHEVEPTAITVVKSSDPASGSTVAPGETIAYTLTVTVANSATTQPLTLTDTLGAGLSFGEVTDAGAFACTGSLVCELPAGTLPGTYAVTYTATVDADATGTLGNVVTATNPPGGDPDPVCATCGTEHEVEPTRITVAKSSDPATGSTVLPNDTIAYTLTVTVANSATTQPLTLTDTLGAGLSFGEVTDAGAFACTGSLVCELPAGTLPGTYAVTYTATVDADATGTLGNVVTATNPPGGDPDPECASCETEHEIEPVVITVVKSSDPASGAEVRAGDIVAYTVTVTVANSVTTEALTLTDTLSGGQTLLPDSIVAPAGGGCEATPDGLVCTLAEGSAPGSYAFAYRVQVDPDATGTIGNVVTAVGGGGEPPECASCSTEHPLAQPVVTIGKSSDPASGAEVSVGDTIEYTLTVTVENAATIDDVILTDTPGAGLTTGALPAGCSDATGQIVCVLASGAVPGTYTFVYPATVNADASGEVRNAVVGSHGGGGEPPECTTCETTHTVVDEASLRIVKSVGARNVRIGDLVRYTVTVENVGTTNVVDGTVIDTPPAGFSYVEGSMAVADGDGAFTLAAGRHPLRIGGLDIAAGQQATIVYLLRVGAGVRPGVHVNEAVAVDGDDRPISNVATAQVTLDSDPLLDDSLIFGTVFDDRDGDGWQDSAELGGVHVQGGFAPGAYIAGSTTVDRGQGPQPEPDASSPLLHGIAIGRIAGRQSVADPIEAHQVVIRQRLRELAFTGDFVLTSDQGVTVRMDADGNTRVEHAGEAAKGLTAAEPTVERLVSTVDGGYEVAYVVSNAGIDERGIPGVRIASVEGLLIETDQYGRYHLADVHGGDWGRGRNFILKVDPATLPPGTVFTTENPRVRRVTPGIPVRFDFGVQLPVQEIPGGTEQVELELGEVIFAPGSAQVRERYLPAIARMAEQVEAYGGGEVVITADGGSEGLAFARAEAVRDALLGLVGGEAAAALSVALRTRADDPSSLVAGLDGDETLLGMVLFDTDRSTIRPEFAQLLDRVAARLEAMGGGVVAITGHTDVRGSHAYNTALGLRRARAVFDALAERLSPQVRSQLRVESSSDPTAPVGTERK